MFNALQNLQRGNDLLAAWCAGAIIEKCLQPAHYTQMESIIFTWQNGPDGKTNAFSACACFTVGSSAYDSYKNGLTLNRELSSYVHLNPETTKQAFLSNPTLLPIQFYCMGEIGADQSPGFHNLIFARK